MLKYGIHRLDFVVLEANHIDYGVEVAGRPKLVEINDVFYLEFSRQTLGLNATWPFSSSSTTST